MNTEWGLKNLPSPRSFVAWLNVCRLLGYVRALESAMSSSTMKIMPPLIMEVQLSIGAIFDRLTQAMTRSSKLQPIRSQNFLGSRKIATRLYSNNISRWRWNSIFFFQFPAVTVSAMYPRSPADNGFEPIDIMDCFC